MKRIRPLLSVMMAMVMLFGMISTAFAAENDTGFSDVAVDADYAQAVAWCNEEGLMQGVSSGRFAPDATLTRAMVATVLYRAADEPSVSGTLAFTDTQTGQWYSNAILWATDRGIVRGYGNGLFGTEDPVTLEQLDIMIRRYNGEEPSWTGSPALNIAATRAEAAIAFYNNLRRDKPSDISNIKSVENVPLITLNNGVQVPQLGLGTQIQRLEGDRSEAGRKLLNDTSHDAVVAALQAGYRHLDTAHGYYNETGVGQAIRDSGVPREEIWVTSKLWPSEYGEGTTMQAIDKMLERLQLDYLDCIYLHHPAGDYLGAWKDLEEAYRQGKVRALGISNFDNWPEAFNAIMEQSEIKPQIMQIEGHPFAQRHTTRELAAQYNIQVECWYPLGHADDRLLNNEVLSQIAQTHNKSVVQIILRWHMQEGFCAVPGSTNPDHIQENISIFDFELTDAEMEQIRAMDRGEEGRYFNLNYEVMGGFFTNPID